MKTEKTNKEFESVLADCRTLYAAKLGDYGAAWRVLRPGSLGELSDIKD